MPHTDDILGINDLIIEKNISTSIFGLSLLIEHVVSTVTVSMSLSKPVTEKPLNALGNVINSALHHCGVV